MKNLYDNKAISVDFSSGDLLIFMLFFGTAKTGFGNFKSSFFRTTLRQNQTRRIYTEDGGSGVLLNVNKLLTRLHGVSSQLSAVKIPDPK
jgi:hypothetical protein